MRPLLPLLLLLAACTGSNAARGPGSADEGDTCRTHADCRVGLLCEDASGTCIPDACTTEDDCDRTRLGEGRCVTEGGVTWAQTCAYDGDRCLEWTPDACAEGDRCEVGPQGARCLPTGAE